MIRDAVQADIPTLLVLGERMHAESRYRHMPWSRAKVAELMDALIASEDGLLLVAERDGEIIGGMLASVAEHYFSPAKVASDFALFVSPDRRGGLAAMSLLRRYASWARERGAVLVQAGITTGINVEAATRLYEVAGFKPIGPLFELEP